MKITIIAVGKLKERYLREGVDEFLKRLRPMATVAIQEIGEEKIKDNPQKADIEKALVLEGERLWRLVPANAYVIVLDLWGKEMDSVELANKIAELGLVGKSHIAFIIGGAYGIADSLRQSANLCLSLSKLTLTHQFARLLLVEQIYRAFKINRGEPYHW